MFVASVLLLALGAAGPRPQAAAEPLPARLSDRAFWQMVTEFSEPGGFFRSDNLVSNESTFQQIIPDLLKKTPRGGVYVGVGPDQNFTYITALAPRMAFIVDIRRQNMLLHLMYKALIETSDDRIEFLSKLFSRERPASLGASATPQDLFDAFGDVPASDALFARNEQALFDWLEKHHGFALSEEDHRAIEYVYRAFYLGGPDLRYSFPQQMGGRWFPTYSELMVETDLEGLNHSYIANEKHFRDLKELETNNLLIPIVGDFGGDKALHKVGEYLREHGATVTYFYTSNVEQYLFQTEAWSKYYTSVGAMPLDQTSTFIRAYFNLRFRSVQSFNAGPRSETLTDPIAPFIGAFRDGRIHTYYDVIERSR